MLSIVVLVSLLHMGIPSDTMELLTNVLNSFVLVIGVIMPLQIATLVLGLRNRQAGTGAQNSAVLDEDGWFPSQARCTLRTPSGIELRLTGTEYLVLQQFASSDTAVPHATFNALIGRDVANPKDRGIDILISRLRRKCSQSGAPLPVMSVRGQGYVFHGRLLTA